MYTMSDRVSLSQYRAVLQGLESGWRQFEIARELGLSPRTVARIADDRRMGREEPSESDLPEDDAPPDYVPQNLRRCSGCGAIVYLWPCLACRMSTKVGRASVGRASGRPEE